VPIFAVRGNVDVVVQGRAAQLKIKADLVAFCAQLACYALNIATAKENGSVVVYRLPV
jgi:hypothetical protein